MSSPRRRWSIAYTFFAAVLPLAGYVAELATGMFAEVGCRLFPTPWHTAAVGLAVLLNLLLHLGVWQAPRRLPYRAAAVAFVTGTTILYALAELPYLPIILFAFVFGLGVLAFAPYWTCLGLLSLWPDLLLRWNAAGRSTRLLLLIILPLLLLVPTAAIGARVVYWRTARLLQSAAMATDPAAARTAMAALRSLPLAPQLEICANGARGGWRDNDLCWFVDNLGARPVVDADAARLAFYRAHGHAAAEHPRPAPRSGRFEDFDDRRGEPASDRMALQQSALEVTAEPDAALARIDWQLQFANTSQRAQEADVCLELPPGAVASGLSLWIQGTERPAAFGGVAAVQAAYDAVTSARRDPALLQETAPGQLRLRVFPVPPGGAATRVRVVLTAPLHLRDDGAWLQLPQVHSTGCRMPSRHELGIVDAGERSQRAIAAAAMAATRLHFRLGSLRARCKDAAGELGQQLVAVAPRATPQHFVLVIDGAGDLAGRCDAVLGALPADAPCALFVADAFGCERRDGKAGDAELQQWLAAQTFAGGIDAVPALLAACAACTKGSALLWLHGRQDVVCTSPAQLAQRLGTAPPLCAVALAAGPNRLRERLGQLVLPLPRTADLAADLRWLCSHPPVPGSAAPFAAFARQFTRAPEAIAGGVPVSDQLARLWAAQEARLLCAAGDATGGAQLATRYRLATAGAAAVVLETDEQYAIHQLNPGAAIGSEPAGPIGGGPVPELPVWVLVATGLLALLLLRRRR